MLPLIRNHQEEAEMLVSYFKEKSKRGGVLKILEAGCGQSWGIDLKGIPYHLTGVDIDKDALMIRKYKTRDLHEIIEGDLRTINLPANKFDVIYNSYVLEHIDGAEKVLEKFCDWLKPGGILILRFPDREAAYGLLTRITPFWFHVFYKKYIMGNPNAGKPGFDPYPVFYDRVVSTKGMREFCIRHNMSIKEEWGHPFPSEWDRFPRLLSLVTRVIHLLSFKQLAHAHNNLTYVIEKAQAPQRNARSTEPLSEVNGRLFV